MTRVLITGGAGFVGSHLAAAQVASGEEVHVVARPSTSLARLQPIIDNITIHPIDLRETDAVRKCVDDVAPEVIYHLAASPRRREDENLEDAQATVQEDLGILIGLLAAAKACRRPPSSFVRTGTLAVYGTAPRPSREDTREQPVTVYAASKLAASYYLAAMSSRLPFRTVSARLALIYGPAQAPDYFIPGLIMQCLQNERAHVNRPSDRRDLVYVDDAVAGLVAAARAELPPATVVNIASGKAPTMRTVARTIARECGVDPHRIDFTEASIPSGAPYLRCSTKKASHLLHFKVSVPLAEGISRTVQWYEKALNDNADILESLHAAFPPGKGRQANG